MKAHASIAHVAEDLDAGGWKYRMVCVHGGCRIRLTQKGHFLFIFSWGLLGTYTCLIQGKIQGMEQTDDDGVHVV